MRFLFRTIVFAGTLAALGCSTSQKVDFSQSLEGVQFRSAHLVPKGGRSHDMDEYFEKYLKAHGLTVTMGPETLPHKTDLVVKYEDSWRWDIAMYLQQLDVQFYDRAGNLAANAQWQNAPMHKFTDEDEIVKNLLNEVFTKIRVAPKK